MAYDFHYSESPPGPITPMNQLIEVIEHNLTYIPKNKFVLGLPTYGYKWGESGGIPLQFYKIDQIITERKLTPSLQLDPFSIKLQFQENGSNHEIWYEDDQTLKKKIEVAQSYGIYQICFWHLGGEDLSLWENDFFEN
jgi:spore germination protein YaaH